MVGAVLVKTGATPVVAVVLELLPPQALKKRAAGMRAINKRERRTWLRTAGPNTDAGYGMMSFRRTNRRVDGKTDDKGDGEHSSIAQKSKAARFSEKETAGSRPAVGRNGNA